MSVRCGGAGGMEGGIGEKEELVVDEDLDREPEELKEGRGQTKLRFSVFISPVLVGLHHCNLTFLFLADRNEPDMVSAVVDHPPQCWTCCNSEKLLCSPQL